MSEDDVKELFERECHAFFQKRKEEGHVDPADSGDGSPESLFWKDEKGNYGVRMFNAAWWGFRIAFKCMGKID